VTATATVPVIRSDLPGADLVDAGLRDLQAGRRTAPALLLLGARARLAQDGIRLPVVDVPNPERALYDLLDSEDPPGAPARYNALRQRLVSFCHAFEADARRRDR
jgi:hypothetical protein